MPALPIASHWIALLAGGLYLLALWRFDAYTPAEVRHWQRLARLRGLDAGSGLRNRLGRRVRVLQRIREEFNIRHLLLVSGRPLSPDSWILSTVGYALAAMAALVAVDGLEVVANGSAPVPAWFALMAAAVVVALRYAGLRSGAVRRQATIGAELADSLLGLAVLVPGIPPEDALALIARCQRDSQLDRLLGGGELARILGEDMVLRSTRERYWALGKTLRIPMFQELSLVMRGIESEGLNPKEEYPALARISAENRLAQNRLRAARAKTMAAAAIALLLVPLLIMVGGGIAFAFLSGFSG